MCWNKEVSLNTFIFSSFVLLLIIYNNEYTQYKINHLNNVWIYIFFVSFILMQFIEYFIWKNIDDPTYNSIFSTLAALLLFFQPIASTMLITDNTVRSIMLTLYLTLSIPFTIYRLITKKIHTTITPLNHLRWDFILYKNNIIDNVFLIAWFIFFLFPLFYSRNKMGFMFGLLTLLLIIYNYAKDGSIGSMWCWVVNTIMIYYAAYLLLYLPYTQINQT